MTTALIDPAIITPEGLIIPDDTNQDRFVQILRTVIICKRASGKWISDARKFGVAKWGIDYVAETEVQLELELGIECKDKPAPLNPADKSRAIVTIEGIAQSFSMWHRKMAAEVETWDRDRLTRALELLEPMEAQARAIRERLGA